MSERDRETLAAMAADWERDHDALVAERDLYRKALEQYETPEEIAARSAICEGCGGESLHLTEGLCRACASLPGTVIRSTKREVTDEMVERAAYPIFVGVAKAPWTSRGDDEPCPVEPFTKNHARNLARAALAAAFDDDAPASTAPSAPKRSSEQSANAPATPPLGETRNTTDDPQ